MWYKLLLDIDGFLNNNGIQLFVTNHKNWNFNGGSDELKYMEDASSINILFH